MTREPEEYDADPVLALREAFNDETVKWAECMKKYGPEHPATRKAYRKKSLWAQCLGQLERPDQRRYSVR